MSIEIIFKLFVQRCNICPWTYRGIYIPLVYIRRVANEKMNPKVSEIISALVFGGVHYFGIAPSGVAGAIMAAFIGWFLAKSINETKGFF